jgi:hypothetical protein
MLSINKIKLFFKNNKKNSVIFFAHYLNIASSIIFFFFFIIYCYLYSKYKTIELNNSIKFSLFLKQNKHHQLKIYNTSINDK